MFLFTVYKPGENWYVDNDIKLRKHLEMLGIQKTNISMYFIYNNELATRRVNRIPNFRSRPISQIFTALYFAIITKLVRGRREILRVADCSTCVEKRNGIYGWSVALSTISATNCVHTIGILKMLHLYKIYAVPNCARNIFTHISPFLILFSPPSWNEVANKTWAERNIRLWTYSIRKNSELKMSIQLRSNSSRH